MLVEHDLPSLSVLDARTLGPLDADEVPHLQGNVMGYLIGLACFFAWLTHVFTCFAQSLWGFLIAGVLFFPIGILHGFYLWFK